MKEDGYQKIMSEEETREYFLATIREAVRYWNNVEGKTKLKALEGLAHSILTVIDGESDHPPCVLRPLVSSVEGEDWLDIGHNIAESLHDNFYQYPKEEK